MRRRLPALIAALLLSGLAALPSHAASPREVQGLLPFAPGKILTGVTPHRVLHFTFDDGPDPRTTPAMLDALDAAQIKATFFFSSSRFADASTRNASARELAREVKRRGHPIGSHSFEHKRMGKMSAAELRRQLDENDRLFTEIFGSRTYLFRPPWGSHSPELDRMLAERDVTMVLWNIGSADWTVFSADKLQANFARALPFLARTKGWGGGIVLMHDTHTWTVQALPRIVADLRAKNCALLDAGEQLYDILPDLSLWDPALADEQREAVIEERQAALRAETRTRCQQK